jgi:chromosome segregation ATPase
LRSSAVKLHAENHARLDELKSRLELQSQKIEQTKSAIANGENLFAKAKSHFDSAHNAREQANFALQTAEEKVINKKNEVAAIDRERRDALEKRTKEESDHSRLKAQLEVLRAVIGGIR